MLFRSTADVFEVSFEATTLDYKVYTNSLQPNGYRLQLTTADWASISDSAKGQAVVVTVRGALSTQPGVAGTSLTATMNVATQDVTGGIYYWSPTGETGATTGVIMRHAFGDTSGTAQQFYAPTASGGGERCVGCHVITHDGTKMAVTYDGGNGAAAIASVPNLSMLLPETSGDKWNFAAYSPDGSRMVATSMGTLKVIDTSGGAANGTVLQTIADGSTGNYASHPDWSADGSKIVYVSVGAPNGQSEWSFGSGSLVVVSDMGAGVFGNPTTIVASTGGVNNYYPSFSPDGNWILFNRGTGQAYTDPTAEAYVVSADGSIGPIPLGNANSTQGNITNSWPRWNPNVVREPFGNLMYFTYSSERDYGIEVVQPNPPTSTNPLQPQIWMAAFDPAKAASGTDPSSTAFWMPYQDVKAHNHIAQWTATFIP